MAHLIERSHLALVLGEEISQEQFDALYRAGITVISAGYHGNPEEATGHAAEVITGVLFGVMVRIQSNPKGARQLVAGPASVTFGGADDDIAEVFTLTEWERLDLEAVSPVRTSGAKAFTIRPGAR